jgi:hypothetical protein
VKLLVIGSAGLKGFNSPKTFTTEDTEKKELTEFTEKFCYPMFLSEPTTPRSNEPTKEIATDIHGFTGFNYL